MPTLIPLGDPTIADLAVTTQLGDELYSLRRVWNDRGACWALDLAGASGEPAVQGWPLRLGMPVALGVVADGVPTGALVLVDEDGTGIECAQIDLGGRCKLLYFTAEEVAALAA